MRLRFERSALCGWLSGRKAASARCFGGPTAVSAASRGEVYRERALQLVREGFAYLCYCSVQELAAMRTRQEAHGQPQRYDRRCLSLYAEHRADYEAAGRKPCVRFKVPGGSVGFEDLLLGEVVLPIDSLEDFVLLEGDGHPGREFARVLDRAGAGVTHVVRGEDQLRETARELLLVDALGLQAPRYAHLTGRRPE